MPASQPIGPLVDTHAHIYLPGQPLVAGAGPYRSPGCDHAALAATLLREAGTERLLFGSDRPSVRHEDEITFAQTTSWFEHFISDPVRRAQIGYTAARLYRFA